MVTGEERAFIAGLLTGWGLKTHGAPPPSPESMGGKMKRAGELQKPVKAGALRKDGGSCIKGTCQHPDHVYARRYPASLPRLKGDDGPRKER